VRSPETGTAQAQRRIVLARSSVPSQSGCNVCDSQLTRYPRRSPLAVTTTWRRVNSPVSQQGCGGQRVGQRCCCWRSRPAPSCRRWVTRKDGPGTCGLCILSALLSMNAYFSNVTRALWREQHAQHDELEERLQKMRVELNTMQTDDQQTNKASNTAASTSKWTVEDVKEWVMAQGIEEDIATTLARNRVLRGDWLGDLHLSVQNRHLPIRAWVHLYCVFLSRAQPWPALHDLPFLLYDSLSLQPLEHSSEALHSEALRHQNAAGR